MANLKPLILLGFVTTWLVVAHAADAPALLDAVFEPGFGPVFRAEPLLLRDGGARIVEWEGARYFLAVGVTSVGEPTTSERLRQIRVGRINALRAAAEFIAPTQVKTETTLRETVTIRQQNGTKSADSRKVLDEITRTRVESVLRVPPQVGTWKSPDGKLFFYAIGAKLP